MKVLNSFKKERARIKKTMIRVYKKIIKITLKE